METMTILVVLAMLDVIVSLAAGISSMVYDDEVGRRHSEPWMTWRVGLQAAAVALLLDRAAPVNTSGRSDGIASCADEPAQPARSILAVA
jgi:hypothetical protein